MPWTVKVDKDTDKEGVGTVTATYTEPENGFSFSFSARGQDTPQQISMFVSYAKAGLAEAKRKKNIEDEVASRILAQLVEGN